MVIGGLLRTNIDDVKTQVPFLGRVPVIGAAFRHKNKTELQRELIIFITPHIILDDVATIASSNNQPGMREQSIPTDKSQAIEKELSSMESQNFNSFQ